MPRYNRTKLFIAAVIAAQQVKAQEPVLPPLPPGTTSHQFETIENLDSASTFTHIGPSIKIRLPNGLIHSLYLFRSRGATDRAILGEDASKPATLIYHEPALCLVSNSKPIHGVPNWVSSVSENAEKKLQIGVRFALSSDALRKAAKAAYIDECPTNNSDVIVEPLPIKRLSARLVDSQGSILAYCEANPRHYLHGQIEMTFVVDPSLVTKLNECKFEFKASLKTTNLQSAVRTVTAEVDVSKCLNEVLSHDQLHTPDLSRPAPILQQDAQHVLSHIARKTTTNAVTDSPELLVVLPSLPIDRFFEQSQLSWTDFLTKYSLSAEKLAALLRPYEITKLDESETINTHGESKETQKGDSGSIAGEILGSASSVLFGLALDGEKAKETLDKVFRETGIRLVESKTHQGFVPTTIRVYNVRDLKLKTTMEAVDVVAVAETWHDSQIHLNGVTMESRELDSELERIASECNAKLKRREEKLHLVAERASLMQTVATSIAALNEKLVTQKALPPEVERLVSDLPSQQNAAMAEANFRGILAHYHRIGVIPFATESWVNSNVGAHFDGSDDGVTSRRSQALRAKKSVDDTLAFVSTVTQRQSEDFRTQEASFAAITQNLLRITQIDERLVELSEAE